MTITNKQTGFNPRLVFYMPNIIKTKGNKHTMQNTPKRGDVFYIKADDNKTPIGSEMWSNRPAIIISNDGNNNTSPIVQIIYLTSSHRKKLSPMHVEIPTCGEHSIAMCEQIYTIDKSRLEKYIAPITKKEIQAIEKALAFCLGLDATNCTTVFKKWENYIKRNKINIVLEQEHLIESTENQAIKNLRKELEILRKEKETYKILAQINETKYQNLLNKKGE